MAPGGRPLAAAALLGAALLAGCAPAAPGSPGLGESDGETAVPIAPDRSAPADPGGREHDVYLDIDALHAPPGTTVAFRRKSANCVRDEVEGTFDASATRIKTMYTVGTGYGTCVSERSWATWTITARTPDGRTASTTFEIAQTNTPLDRTMAMEAKCWGDGTLACRGSEDAQAGWGTDMHLRLHLDWP